MELLEEIKFAITWEELEEDRIRYANKWYITYRNDIPEWLMKWMKEKREQFGLLRITNILRILGNDHFYLSESHEGCNLPLVLELFCTVPRSLKLMAALPKKSAFVWALSTYMLNEEMTTEQMSWMFQKNLDFFWRELAKNPAVRKKEILLSVFRLLKYVSPDEILCALRTRYWSKALMDYDKCELRDIETDAERIRYYKIMLHTPAIQAIDTQPKRADAVKLIMNKDGADRYLNMICCDSFLRYEFGFDFAMRMANKMEDPGKAADCFARWEFDNNAQKAGMVRLIVDSEGNPRFLKMLEQKASEWGTDERDRLLTSTPLHAAGIICKCEEAERIESAFRNIGTASVVLGQSNFPGHDFMIEAVLKRKKALLRYLNDGDLSAETVAYLCDKDDYVQQFLYLNAWSAGDINKLAKADGLAIFKLHGSEILDLGQKFQKNAPYTYQEVQAFNCICSSETGYYQRLNIFFTLLGRLRSEEACRRICQFSKRYENTLTAREAENVIVRLSQGDLPSMSRKLLSIPVSSETAAKVMTTSTDLEPILRLATTETEVLFAIENPGLCKNGLEEGMKCFLDKDDTVQKVKEELGLPDEFYREHEDTVWKFLASGNGSYVHSYMNVSSVRDAFKVVVKAAMCDQLNELRYTDLDKECCMDISDRMYEHWTQDDVQTIDGYQIYEDTTFRGIMNLGAVPTRTCMNYANGMYRQCLLAYFDGNKKIIYVKQNDTVVARAVIRLTKTANQLVDQSKERLSFTDVTDNHVVKNKTSVPFIETPVVFLERCYSGIQGKKRREIESAIIHFAMEKADKIGCGFLVSGEYLTTVETTNWHESLSLTLKSVFITRSKAGEQYLDSFGGVYSNKGGYSPENTYVTAKCFCEASLANVEAEE